MSDNNESRETLADIIREKREMAAEIRAHLSIVPARREDQLLEADSLDREADRLEAARHTSGNAAAMREALLFVKQYYDKIDPFNLNTYTSAQIEVDHIQDAISAALSAPARNCDVGTPEEQGERCLAQFEQWRRKGDGKKLITAIMTWAQMPYTAEEGGAE